MIQHVWISNARNDSTLIKDVDTEISQNSVEKSIEGIRLNKAGKAVPADLCPTRIWGTKHFDPAGNSPPLFDARGHWIVSAEAAEVLRRFDLGGGALHPVTEGVFRKDNATRVPGDFFCWIFGNVKYEYDASASVNMKEPAVPGLWWTMPWNIGDDDVAVGAGALAGADIWLDPMLFKSVFMSGPLGDALAAAGFAKTFRLLRCRVVSGARS